MAKSMQDTFLNAVRKGKIPCTVIVTNGFQIKEAIVTAFDNFSVLIENADGQKLIFKHAISSIAPSVPVDITVGGDDNEQ